MQGILTVKGQFIIKIAKSIFISKSVTQVEE